MRYRHRLQYSVSVLDEIHIKSRNLVFFSIIALQHFVEPWQLFQFLNLLLYTVGRTSWTGDQPFARALPTHRTAQIQNNRTQTCIPRVEFEPTMSVFERTKTVHALDRAATVIGS
jgi:hypothetical protein